VYVCVLILNPPEVRVADEETAVGFASASACPCQFGIVLEYNLRHLRVLLAVAEHGSITRAAELCRVSQPAVTQAIAKLERLAGSPLFTRSRRGLFPTESGQVLANRIARALAFLDRGTLEFPSNVALRATFPQLQAIIAVQETENYTLAAARLGIAQPTIHRAVSQLEREAGVSLFERKSHGMVASRSCEAIVTAARLAFAELAQAETDLADFTQREVGRIVVGAMPLSRAQLLPEVIAAFRSCGRQMSVQVVDGPYGQLLAGLRRGEIDFLIGAMRQPAPISDVVQKPLFDDYLAMVCRPGHPLANKPNPTLEELSSYPWIVAQAGAPSRARFDQFFTPLGERAPRCLVESGPRELYVRLLEISDHLGCMSVTQALPSIKSGILVQLQLDMAFSKRAIGITTRLDWLPTAAQRHFLDLVETKAETRQTINSQKL